MREYELWCIGEIARYQRLETAEDMIKTAGEEGMKNLPASIRMALINRAAGKQLDPFSGDVLKDQPSEPEKPSLPKPTDYNDAEAERIPF